MIVACSSFTNYSFIREFYFDNIFNIFGRIFLKRFVERAVVPPRNTLIKRCQKWKQAVVIGVLRREAHEPLQIGPDKIFRGKNECNVVNPFAGGFRRCIASTCARISRKSIHFPSDGSQLSHSAAISPTKSVRQESTERWKGWICPPLCFRNLLLHRS